MRSVSFKKLNINKTYLTDVLFFCFLVGIYDSINLKTRAQTLVFHFCEIRYAMFKSGFLCLLHLIFRIYEYMAAFKNNTFVQH